MTLAGGTVTSATLFGPDGARTTSVLAAGQTVDLQPSGVVFDHRQGGTSFVYAPGSETGWRT